MRRGARKGSRRSKLDEHQLQLTITARAWLGHPKIGILKEQNIGDPGAAEREWNDFASISTAKRYIGIVEATMHGDDAEIQRIIMEMKKEDDLLRYRSNGNASTGPVKEKKKGRATREKD